MALTQEFPVDAASGFELVSQGNAAPITSAWTVLPTDGVNSQSYTASGEAKVIVSEPLPAGTNLIGSVDSRTQDGTGTPITSTTLGGKQLLDVNVASITQNPVLSASGLLTAVPAAASTTPLLGSNPTRRGFYLFNDSKNTAWVAFASTGSTSVYSIKMLPNSFYEDAPTIFSGAISAIWDGTNGAMHVTELV